MIRLRGRTPLVFVVSGMLLAALLSACSDLGKEPVLVPPGPLVPTIQDLAPRRTVVGDTVRVEGALFGAAQGGSSILFASTAAPVAGDVVSWSDALVEVLVPDAAIDGPIVARIENIDSNSFDFEVAPAVVSYPNDLFPIFDDHGCLICHSVEFGGTLQGEFAVYPRDAFLSTGSPPGVVPRKSHQSEVIRRLRIPLGDLLFEHMPQIGSGYDDLTEAEITAVADWIDQGAAVDSLVLP